MTHIIVIKTCQAHSQDRWGVQDPKKVDCMDPTVDFLNLTP